MSEKELVEFVENLTSSQFKSVLAYFDSLPQLEIACNYTTSDKVQRKITIKGIFDFIDFFFNHLSLQLFYIQTFQLNYHHKYSLNEIENMIPFERSIYTEQIRLHLSEVS